MSKGWDDLSELLVAKDEATRDRTNLLLIDGNNLAYRYFNRPNYSNYTDEYIKTIDSLGKSYDAKKIICTFDSRSAYRKAIYPEYKANRDILKEQQTEEEKARYDAFFECLNDTIDRIPFEYYRFRGVEADDLIAYIARKNTYPLTWIVSSDRDLYQLLSSKVKIFNIFSRKEITEETLKETLGLTPREYMMTKVIEGDTGDNVIGIDGIGIKRATGLIQKYGSLQGVIDAIPIKGKAQYIKNLNAGKDKLILNERLVNLDYHELSLTYSDTDNIIEILNQVGA